MARETPSPQESIQPNVVPLLDIMFLLLVFLMLGSDMSVRENAELALETATEAKAPPAHRQGRVVTLNVLHREGVACAAHEAGRPCREGDHWRYAMQGKDVDEAALGERLTAVALDDVEPASVAGTPLSAVTLSIRCDRGAPFGRVQEALLACASAGIHKMEVAAAMPAAE